MTIAIQMLRTFLKKKTQQAYSLHRQICLMNHGNYGYREKNFHRMLKETFTTLSMTQKQQRPQDTEDIDVPARRQATQA
jgi:hypothetical protein